MRSLKCLMVLLCFLCFECAYAHAQESTVQVILTEEESAYLKTLGPIKLCVDPDWYPYEQIDPDGKYQGIAADLLNVIARRLGSEFELVPTKDWEETIEYSKAMRCDVVSLLNQTPDREKWLVFTDPYFTDPTVLITREAHDYVSDLGRVTDETVVLPEGTSVEERLRKDYPNLTIVTVSSELEAMRYVSEGKADFTLRSQTMAAYTIRKEGLFNLKIAGHIPDYANNLRFGVNKRMPLLCHILNKGIATLTQTDVNAAVNHHVAVEVIESYDRKRLVTALAALLSVVAVGLVWIYQLNTLNRKLRSQKQELSSMSEALSKSEALYKSFVNASPDTVIITDSKAIIEVASPKIYPLLGLDAKTEDLRGRYVGDFIAPVDQERLRANIAARLAGKSIGIAEYAAVRKDGHSIILEVSSDVTRGLDNVGPRLVSIVRNVTERRQMEDNLRKTESELRALTATLANQNEILNHKITIDPLTGILNRYTFDQRLYEEIAAYNAKGVPVSLLLFDLDKFKDVNDTHGHDVGDHVLIRISACVERIRRSQDIFARWGGEEFVVLMPQTSLDDALRQAETIRAAVEKIDHSNVGAVTISIGAAQYHTGESVEDWFRRTDQALYRAKKEGRNRVWADFTERE